MMNAVRFPLKLSKIPLRLRIFTENSLKATAVCRTGSCYQFRNHSSYSGLSYFHAAGEIPLTGITVGGMLEKIGKEHGGKLGVIDCEQNIRKTFSEYLADIEKMAAGLMSLGMKKGDRLGIWSPNSYEWLVTQYACAITGIILVCVNYLYQPKELEASIKFTGVKTLIAGDKLRGFPLYKILEVMLPNLAQSQSGSIKSEKFPDLEHLIMISKDNYPGTYKFYDILNAGTAEDNAAVIQARKSVQIHDPLHICFSSGTTGAPKAVASLHHAVVNGILTQMPYYYLTENEQFCVLAPLFHALGLIVGSYGSMLSGHTCVLPSGVYSPTKNLEAIKNEKCSAILGTPTMYLDILNQPNFNVEDVASLKTGIATGAPLPRHLQKKINEKFTNCDLFNGYGSTETTVGFVLQSREGKPVEGTVGKVQSHMEVKVVDEDGKLVPWNVPGELLCRGYLVTPGYWNNPKKTEEVMTADNFYKTGDIVSLNEDGILSLMGRNNDVINRGGEKIYPLAIEDHLATHPKILESHVFGVPDERLGEHVAAWILLPKDVTMTSEEVIAHCTGQIAKFQIPHYMKFVHEVPRLQTGKANKLVMKQQTIEGLK